MKILRASNENNYRCSKKVLKALQEKAKFINYSTWQVFIRELKFIYNSEKFIKNYLCLTFGKLITDKFLPPH